MENADFTVSRLTLDKINAARAREVSGLISYLSGSEKKISAPDLRRMAKSNFVVVARPASDADRVVGIACLVVMDLPQGKRFLVESVVVHADFQRIGIGRQLIRALIAEAKTHGNAPLSLTCNPNRPAARRLYGALGFQTANTSVFRLALT